MWKKIVFLFRLCLMPWLGLFAQNYLAIQTDKQFYATGEQMGIMVGQNHRNPSGVIYVQMLDQNGQVLQTLTLKDKNSLAAALFSIPLNWNSNWYIIRAYTLWLPDFQIRDIAYKVIPIYNEFEAPTTTTDTIESIDIPTASQQIETDKEVYQKGEQVQVTINPISNRNLTFQTVAVFDEATFTLNTYFEQIVPQLPSTHILAPGPDFEPQHKLLYLGEINDSIEQLLGALYIAEEGMYSFVSLSTENRFGLEMPDFSGKKHAQFIGVGPIGGFIYLNPKISHTASQLVFPQFSLPEFPYPIEIINYLEDSRKRKIINELYEGNKVQLDRSKNERFFFSKADLSYSPADYIQFQTTEDFIREVATFIKLRPKNGKMSMRVLMEKNQLSPYEPIMFLNGYMLSNPEELIKLELDEIERIDVYRKEKTILKPFGILGRHGVIAFYTKDPNMRPQSGNSLELKGFVSDNPVIRLADNPGPVFSPRLYWNPFILPDNDGRVLFTFSLSDDRGLYFIVNYNFEAGKWHHLQKGVWLQSKN